MSQEISDLLQKNRFTALISCWGMSADGLMTDLRQRRKKQTVVLSGVEAVEKFVA